MVKQLLLIATLTTSAAAGTNSLTERFKAKIAGPYGSIVVDNNVRIPSQEIRIVKDNAFNPSDGIIIGSTYYDYGWNSGTRRMIVTHNNGAHVHMTFTERMDSLGIPSNSNQRYVYYDSSSKVLKTANFGSQAGSGAVGVFSGGAGDNTCVMVVHTPVSFGIDSGPGAGNFTVTKIPAALGSINDPHVLVVDKTQTIFVDDTRARSDYQVLKSTDFGATWTQVDTLMKYAPKNSTKGLYSIGSLDVPILLGPNGTLALVTTLTGNGEIPPMGAAGPDSADLIGAFTSTNGSTWSWTTWGRDGDKVIIGTDTVYVLWQNFGQVAGAYDKSSNLHIVANGYSVKKINDTTYQTYFYVLWKKTGQSDWTAISKTADARAFNWDSAKYKYSGNAYGFCYPTVSIDTNSTNGTLFVAWSQPRITNGKVDTFYNGYSKYDIYYNSSANGGTIWNDRQKLTSSEGGLFTTAAPYLVSVNQSTRRAHLVYLADTAGGCSAFTGTARAKVNWVYRTVDFLPLAGRDDVRPTQDMPNQFTLSQNYPNPFNPTTKIDYSIGKNLVVNLKVYNILGQEIATLVEGMQEEGNHSISFDASRFASGLYVYKLQAGSFTEVKKMVLVK